LVICFHTQCKICLIHIISNADFSLELSGFHLDSFVMFILRSSGLKFVQTLFFIHSFIHSFITLLIKVNEPIQSFREDKVDSKRSRERDRKEGRRKEGREGEEGGRKKGATNKERSRKQQKRNNVIGKIHLLIDYKV